MKEKKIIIMLAPLALVKLKVLPRWFLVLVLVLRNRIELSLR